MGPETYETEHDTALQRDMIVRLVLQIRTRILMELVMISSSEGHDCQIGTTDMDPGTHGIKRDTDLQRYCHVGSI
jgi:hypothetical protein